MTESGKILTAVTVGALAGLITGILIAPDKGSETRRKIADGAHKIADGAQKVADQVKETATAGVDAVTNFKNKLTHRREMHATVVGENND